MYGEYTKHIMTSHLDDGEVATALAYDNAIGAEESAWILMGPITVTEFQMLVKTAFTVTTAPVFSLFRKAHTDLAAGADDASSAADFMTDSGAGATVNEFIGWTIYNFTNKSRGIITANTATTVTASMFLDSDGTTADTWDTSDVYIIGYELATVTIPITTTAVGEVYYARVANVIGTAGCGRTKDAVGVTYDEYKQRGPADMHTGEQLAVYSSVLGVGSVGTCQPAFEYNTRPEVAENMLKKIESA